MLEDVQTMVDHLAEKHPDVTFKINYFPSGYIMLDIRQGDRWYVLECKAGEGIGISLLTETNGWTRGNDAGFNVMPDAEEYIHQRLSEQYETGRRHGS